LTIVARASNPGSVDKLTRAGADQVVSPYVLSGHRMAFLAQHPAVVDFLDLVGIAPDLKLEEIKVRPGSALDGATTGAACAAHRGATILAVKRPGVEPVAFPGPDVRLEAEDLVVGSTAARLGTVRLYIGTVRLYIGRSRDFVVARSCGTVTARFGYPEMVARVRASRMPDRFLVLAATARGCGPRATPRVLLPEPGGVAAASARSASGARHRRAGSAGVVVVEAAGVVELVGAAAAALGRTAPM
jgi:hypothetical protein